MDDKHYSLPTGKEVGNRATRATHGGSLMELMKAARKTAKAEPQAETTAGEQPDQEIRIKKWIMLSKSIGLVELVYDEDKPDEALVGGVEYRSSELKTLSGKRLRRKDILAAHEIKRVFGGRVLGTPKGMRRRKAMV